MSESLPRVMWLLNHSSAREFEVAMLKRLGFAEVFLPKLSPQEVAFRSGSIDSSEDANLTIPAGDLAILNAADWYREPGRDAWEVANAYFSLLFFIPHSRSIFYSVSRHFRGAAILRGYGLTKGNSYEFLHKVGSEGVRTIENLGRRFWLGTAYRHLSEVEPAWLQEREVFLPIGMSDCHIREDWSGEDAAIFFVCPDIVVNPYYKEVFREFANELEGFPHAVAGNQAVMPNNPNVLGFVSAEQHRLNLRRFRVMFYHSSEPNHIHYHPFEAVRAGMPLVFLGGGMLDRLGGIDLPGRCANYKEARKKLRRILGGDKVLIESIRKSQTCLLDGMRPEKLEPAWRRGLTQVISELNESQASRPVSSQRPRIAVILPVAYRGGTLRSAKLLAQALWMGSREAGEDVDVIFAYPNTTGHAPDGWDLDLPESISRRTIEWRTLDSEMARRAMRYAGHGDWTPLADPYLVADDGVHQLYDCRLWIVVSDRLNAPLLPLRPYMLMVYDYVQRYDVDFPAGADWPCLDAARRAKRVLVTTRFTERDALTYAGVPRERVLRVPMLAPEFPDSIQSTSAGRAPYFLWVTNAGRHKNHHIAMCALREYYESLNGLFDCHVCGIDTARLVKGDLPHLEPVAGLLSESDALRRRVRFLGEIPDSQYWRQLASASFLWHPARIDNGTLTVIEAAIQGVPSLSSRYPAMEEMEAAFRLNLTWMDPGQPDQAARQLKWMEEHMASVKARVPARSELAKHSVECLAGEYWKAVREWV